MNKKLKNIDLSTDAYQNLIDLLEQHLPNTEVWAYGSRVKFTAKPYSDLDLVAFATPEQALAVHNLIEAFEESSLPCRIDLFVWDEIPEQFHKNIREAYRVIQKSTPAKNTVPSPSPRNAERI